jgi:hypothetical protein
MKLERKGKNERNRQVGTLPACPAIYGWNLKMWCLWANFVAEFLFKYPSSTFYQQNGRDCFMIARF